MYFDAPKIIPLRETLFLKYKATISCKHLMYTAKIKSEKLGTNVNKCEC